MLNTHKTIRISHQRRAGAFSLIEALVASAILGMGVAALLTSVTAGTQANAAGTRITRAAALAQEIREWTLKLPFRDPDEEPDAPVGPEQTSPLVFVDDLDDMMDVTYSPPRDGQGSPITDMTNWSQKIAMTWRSPANLSTTVSPGTSDIIHVQVDILFNSNTVLSTGWIVTKREE